MGEFPDGTAALLPLCSAAAAAEELMQILGGSGGWTSTISMVSSAAAMPSLTGGRKCALNIIYFLLLWRTWCGIGGSGASDVFLRGDGDKMELR